MVGTLKIGINSTEFKENYFGIGFDKIKLSFFKNITG